MTRLNSLVVYFNCGKWSFKKNMGLAKNISRSSFMGDQVIYFLSDSGPYVLEFWFFHEAFLPKISNFLARRWRKFRRSWFQRKQLFHAQLLWKFSCLKSFNVLGSQLRKMLLRCTAKWTSVFMTACLSNVVQGDVFSSFQWWLVYFV